MVIIKCRKDSPWSVCFVCDQELTLGTIDAHYCLNKRWLCPTCAPNYRSEKCPTCEIRIKCNSKQAELVINRDLHILTSRGL